MKLLAVASNGLDSPLPDREYAPQEIPAIDIRIAPTGCAAVMPLGSDSTRLALPNPTAPIMAVTLLEPDFKKEQVKVEQEEEGVNNLFPFTTLQASTTKGFEE